MPIDALLHKQYIRLILLDLLHNVLTELLLRAHQLLEGLILAVDLGHFEATLQHHHLGVPEFSLHALMRHILPTNHTTYVVGGTIVDVQNLLNLHVMNDVDWFVGVVGLDENLLNCLVYVLGHGFPPLGTEVVQFTQMFTYLENLGFIF